MWDDSCWIVRWSSGALGGLWRTCWCRQLFWEQLPADWSALPARATEHISSHQVSSFIQIGLLSLPEPQSTSLHVRWAASCKLVCSSCQSHRSHLFTSSELLPADRSALPARATRHISSQKVSSFLQIGLLFLPEPQSTSLHVGWAASFRLVCSSCQSHVAHLFSSCEHCLADWSVLPARATEHISSHQVSIFLQIGLQFLPEP